MARNWVGGAVRAMHDRKDRIAVWTPKRTTTFGELRDLSARAQALFRRHGVGGGDHVLMLDLPGPRLYAAIIAVLSLGAGIVFVEPWMAPNKIDNVLRLIKPKVFFAPTLGKLWGARVAGIREIPTWVSPKEVDVEPGTELVVEEVSPDAHAIVTFSSGTSGEPKGVVRSHGYLVTIEDMFGKYDIEAENPRPDLSIFPNLVLLHLSKGRTTVLVPHSWKAEHLAAIGSLPEELQPASAACGPAFLARLLEAPGFPRLTFIGVGGALCDCAVFEAAFKRFPEVSFAHIYGGTEVEPVAHADAREAVKKSRARGLYQTLFVGAPIPELAADPREEGLWVSGPNVCPEYLGAIAENKLYKRRDAENRLWHFMGDRVVKDDEGWWYSGRSFQTPDDFGDEQRLYTLLESSKSFIHRTPAGRRVLIGEGVAARRSEIFRQVPSLAEVIEGRIARDARHRARIDRKKSAARVARAIARVDAG
jgi:acyl-coenzyme A synthetase/AMP-(fatty) acid ligase